MCVNSKKDDTACREVFDKIQELVREGVFEIWGMGWKYLHSIHDE